MNDTEKRKKLSEVALGNIAPDTVITNGTVFNVFTGEFIKQQSIWVKDGSIAYVGPDQDPSKGEKVTVIDADGMVLLPGLIDGHTHTISNRMGIEEFIKHVIPTGTTTVVTETMEFAPIVGKDGIECVAKGLEKQPIRFYYTVPAMCGLTLSEEINAPTNEELLPLLKDPRCLGVGEIYWGNIFLEGRQGERVRELVSIALGLGKIVEGHSAGARGRKLQAYACFGVSSCHEPISEDEVLERLRLGYSVMLREGSVRKELDGVKGIFRKKIDFRRLTLATDGVDPEGFLEEGYLDAALKRALKLGVSPAVTYQMVTINVADHFRLDHLIGSLSPGRMADILIIPSPDDFSPQLVMCDGKIIYRDGKSMVEPEKIFFPDYMFNTVKIHDGFPNGEALALPAGALAKAGKARVMELVTRLVTQEKIIDLRIPGQSEDLITILAMDRLGRGKAFMGLLKGLGLQKGAYGSTMCWDTTDMIVVGCDPRSMETVIGRLKGIGGGGVYAVGGEVVAEFPAPLCGLVSLKPMEVVREEVRRVEESLRNNGVAWEKPMLTVDTLGSPAIPHLKISHEGYVRLRDQKILPLQV
ncbi:MAG: adenine deaminase C-terminal domain-containing protein [Thermodesulfobacteriota bacterium]|jgi:adenine deaminase